MPKFIDPDSDMDDWPNCLVNSCTNKACVVLDSRMCFVHIDGDPEIKRLKIAMIRAQTFGESELEP